LAGHHDPVAINPFGVDVVIRPAMPGDNAATYGELKPRKSNTSCLTPLESASRPSHDTFGSACSRARA
jgi:hypothetical protein